MWACGGDDDAPGANVAHIQNLTVSGDLIDGTRNIGDATTPIVAKVYASDAPLKPSVTDAANLVWVSAGDDSDETVINQAITYLGSTLGITGVVELSLGTFTIDGAISFSTYEHIILSGQGATMGYDPTSAALYEPTIIKQKDGANLNAMITNDQTQDAIYYGLGVNNIAIDGNKANQTGGDGHGIKLNASQMVLDSVSVEYCRGSALYLDHDDSGSDNAAGNSIINCNFKYNAIGIEVNRHITDIRLTSVNIGGNTTAGELFHSGSMLQHTNCTIWASNLGTNAIVIKGDVAGAGGIAYIYYTGCVIAGANQHLVQMDCSNDNYSISDVTFSSCLFSRPGITADNTYDFINFVSGSTSYIYRPVFNACKFLRESGTDAPRYFFNWTARVVDPIVQACHMDSAIGATALDNGILPLRLNHGNNSGLFWPGQTLKMVGWLTHATKAVSFDALPAGYSLEIKIVLVEAFDSDGTDNIYVGYSGVAGAYAGALNGSGALGVYTTLGGTLTRGALCGYNDASHTVRAEYFDGGSDATVGKALVEITAAWVGVSP